MRNSAKRDWRGPRAICTDCAICTLMKCVVRGQLHRIRKYRARLVDSDTSCLPTTALSVRLSLWH